jgi:hypothetical protein
MTNDTMLENGAFTPSVRKALTQRVRLSLRKAEEHTSGLQKTNSRLLVVSIVSSSAATFVAGFTAANGPVVGEGTAGWIIACLHWAPPATENQRPTLKVGAMRRQT